MKSLPADVQPYKRTPEFTELTVPAGLLKGHSTKAGVWATIVVLQGSLLYRILEPVVEDVELAPGRLGIVEPTVLHEVALRPGTRFYVEFQRVPAD